MKKPISKKRIREPLDIAQYTRKLAYRPHRLIDIRRCGRCGAGILREDIHFCPICGSRSMMRGKASEMIYKKIKLNENGKAVLCPHCSNEELTPGDFCIICGSEIVNRCADTIDESTGKITRRGCRTILPGNARFCYKCGNEATFYQRGWLKDWRSENTRKAIENVAVAVDYEELKAGRTSG